MSKDLEGLYIKAGKYLDDATKYKVERFEAFYAHALMGLALAQLVNTGYTRMICQQLTEINARHRIMMDVEKKEGEADAS